MSDLPLVLHPAASIPAAAMNAMTAIVGVRIGKFRDRLEQAIAPYGGGVYSVAIGERFTPDGELGSWYRQTGALKWHYQVAARDALLVIHDDLGKSRRALPSPAAVIPYEEIAAVQSNAAFNDNNFVVTGASGQGYRVRSYRTIAGPSLVKVLTTLGRPSRDVDGPAVVPGLPADGVWFRGTHLGGHGTALVTGEVVWIGAMPDSLRLGADDRVAWADVVDVAIGGPGVYQTGGGWVGGGFGIQGALEGALFASVMNALTTRTRVETVVRVVTRTAEVNLLTDAMSPQELDLRYSAVRHYLAGRSAAGVHARTGIVADASGTPAAPMPATPTSAIPSEAPRNRFCTSCGQPFAGEAAAFCGSCGAARTG